VEESVQGPVHEDCSLEQEVLALIELFEGEALAEI
jgi:hypothetical protein